MCAGNRNSRALARQAIAAARQGWDELKRARNRVETALDTIRVIVIMSRQPRRSGAPTLLRDHRPPPTVATTPSQWNATRKGGDVESYFAIVQA